jgi:hypothetical protein
MTGVRSHGHARCPECGIHVALTKLGKFRVHGWVCGNRDTRCPASSQIPPPPPSVCKTCECKRIDHPNGGRCRHHGTCRGFDQPRGFSPHLVGGVA